MGCDWLARQLVKNEMEIHIRQASIHALSVPYTPDV
jgi:acid stress-induced BolA-like protein IbaG/YrbA